MKKYALLAAIAVVAVFLFQRLGSEKRATAHNLQPAPPDSESHKRPHQTNLSHALSPDSHPTNDAVQPKGVGGTASSYTLSLSNITLTSVMVEGPTEKLIGTEKFEVLAKKAYMESLEHEKKLKKVKEIIEAEKPDTDRLYSAVHLVYAMRADVLDSRQRKFSAENASAVRIGELEGDLKLSESEKTMRIQSEVNQLNIWKLSFEMDARNREDRFLSHMASLVGELSEATLDRLNAFEPRFAPQLFEP